MSTQRATIITLATFAVLFGMRTPAAAQQIGVTIKIAVDPSIGGTMHDAGSGSVDGLDLAISSQSWTDTHSQQSPLFVGGVDIPIGSYAQGLASFEYGRAGADAVTAGTANGEDVFAQFEPYQFWGLEAGVRAGLREGVGAYGIASVGFRHVNAIRVTISNQDVNQFERADFYQASTVPTFGFGAGFMFGAIGVEAMAKYAGGLSAAENAGPLLEPLATRGERWSLPVSLVIRF